jgi:hypothetical protein
MKLAQQNLPKEVAKEEKKTFNAQILINVEHVIHFQLTEENAQLFTNTQMLQFQNTETLEVG